MTEHKAERAPWGDFPAVVRNGDLKDLSKEPEYEAAKHGDHKAMSYKRMKPAEDELHCEIKALLDRAKATDDQERNEPELDIPAEISRREKRLEAIQAAKARPEARQREADQPGGAAKTMAAGLAIRMARTRAVARTNASLVCRMTVIRKASPIRTAGS